MLLCDEQYNNKSSDPQIVPFTSNSSLITSTTNDSEPKKGRGRPLSTSIETRTKLAYLAANCTSIASAGKALNVALMDLKNQVTNGHEYSDQTTTRSLQESFLALSMYHAKLLSDLYSLYLGIDCYSDATGRDLMAIKFGGGSPKGKVSFVANVVEMSQGHSAVNQTQEIISRLDEYNKYQKMQGSKITLLCDFQLIVYDNTSSNRGQNGVFGILNKERKAVWEKQTKEYKERNPFQDIAEKGCDDHIVNLGSKEFEQRLVQHTKNWNFNHMITKGGKHAATFVVIHLSKMLTGATYKGAFREFLAIHKAPSFPFTRVVETRFSSIEILSSNIFRFYNFIIKFFVFSYYTLTNLEKNIFAALRNQDVLAIIKIRAFKAHFFDLRFMEASNKIENTEVYLQFIQTYQYQLNSFAKEPTLLLNTNLVPRLGIEFDEEVSSIIKNEDKKYLIEKQASKLIESIKKTNEKESEQSQFLLFEEVDELETDNNFETEVAFISSIEELETEVIPYASEVPTVKELQLQQISSNHIQDPIFIARSQPEVVSRLPPSKNKETPPQNRFIVYAEEAFKSTLYHLEKHNKNFFEQKVDSRLIITTTSREIERVFGQVKNLLERNINFNTGNLRNIICLRGVPIQQLYQINSEYSLNNKLLQTGRKVMESSPKRKDQDKNRLHQLELKNKQIEKKVKTAENSIKEEAIRKVLEENGIIVGKRITNDSIEKYLRKIGKKLPSPKTKENLIMCISNEITQKVQQALSQNININLLELNNK